MMNIRLSTGFAALGCVLLASCYPVNENPNQKKATKAPATKVAAKPDPQALKEQEAQKKKQQEELAQNNPRENPNTQPSENPKSSDEPKREYPYGIKVPGKDNVILNPYNNKLVRFDDTPPPRGTLLNDESVDSSEKKFFRMP